MIGQLYLGIDLDDEYAVMSACRSDKREPETISAVAGREVFQIPMLLAKRAGSEQWVIGEEAASLSSTNRGGEVNQLLSRALRHEKVYVDEQVYPAEELLAFYLKRLLAMGGCYGKGEQLAKIAITLPTLSGETAEVFAEVANRLGIAREQIMLLDRKESFYYFAYSQHEDLCVYDICLFDYRGENLSCCRLERNRHTRPQVISLSEEVRRLDGHDRDEAFLHVLEEYFRGRIVSAIYLIGDGFAGDWMKRSVSFMCQGRRAFIGKNLYSKGACYAALIKAGEQPWPYVYLGENVMKVNVSLKVQNRGRMDFYTLIGAGENWYESEGECEVILDGSPEIQFWLQPPHSKEARIEKLALADLPKRPDRTTRLLIQAKPLSDKRVRIRIRDEGFGEYFKSSDKMFEYIMEL